MAVGTSPPSPGAALQTAFGFGCTQPSTFRTPHTETLGALKEEKQKGDSRGRGEIWAKR